MKRFAMLCLVLLVGCGHKRPVPNLVEQNNAPKTEQLREKVTAGKHNLPEG